MAVDVILAEAMVTDAFGAVAELKVRVVRIRAAADRTFVPIKAGGLFAADLLRRPLEVDGGIALFENPEHAEQIISAEEEEVQNGHHRDQVCRERQGKDTEEEEHGVHQSKPLHLDRDNEEQQHLHIREEGGKGKEHGEIDILRRKADWYAGYKIHEKAVQNGEDDSGEEIDIEPGRPPLSLECGADEVIEIERDEGKETSTRRDKYKGDQPPDMPVENIVGIEGHIRENARIDHIEQPHNGTGDRQIPHQVRDAEIRMLHTKDVNLFSHESSSLRDKILCLSYYLRENISIKYL